jgi:hypothetical protein
VYVKVKGIWCLSFQNAANQKATSKRAE